MLNYDHLLRDVESILKRNPGITQIEISKKLGKSNSWLAGIRRNDSRFDILLRKCTPGRKVGQAAPNKQIISEQEYSQIKNLVKTCPEMTQIEMSIEIGKPSYWITAMKKTDSRLQGILNLKK